MKQASPPKATQRLKKSLGSIGVNDEGVARIRDQQIRRQKVMKSMRKKGRSNIDIIGGVASLGAIQGLTGSIGMAFIDSTLTYITLAKLCIYISLPYYFRF